MTDKSLSKISYLLTMVLFVAALVFGLSLHAVKGNAQIVDQNYQVLLDRDKSVSDEKVSKANQEAENIRRSIVAGIGKKDSRFILVHDTAPHLIYHAVGRRGETQNSLGWKNGGTMLDIGFRLGFDKEDTLLDFRNGLEAISTGELFEVPGIGEEARLIKNVEFNKEMTSVGLHFTKGRAKVSVYITNHKRSTVKNEKNLMEIVRLIEPLIVAKASFDDL